MRNTIQRQLILNIIQEMHNHPSAESIYQALQVSHPSISRSTVYRNLHQLAEEGEIRSVLIPESPERFDSRLPQHYHFRCKKCGTVFDIDIHTLSELNQTVENAYGFQVDDHDVIFQGFCPKCKGQEVSL